MPDKWAQYAQQPSTAGQGTDKWAQYAQPAAAADAQPDDRNGLQKAVDSASTVTPEQREGHSLPVNMLQDFGAHVIGSLAGPIVHPVETLKSIGRTAAQVASGPAGQFEAARDAVEPIVKDFSENGASVAIPHILGDAAGGYLGGEIGGAGLRGVTRIANKIAPTLAESALNMRGPDRAYGAEPGRAILDETSGFTPKRIVETGRQSMNDIQTEQGQILANAGNAGGRVDLFPARKLLSDFVDRAELENHPGTIKDLEKLSGQLDTYHASGRVIPPQVTPLEAGALNRGISNAITSWNPATVTDTMNAAGKMAHHSLGESIEAVVPEVGPLNQRMQSLHPVLQRGTAADLNAGPTQRMIGRLRAHTGALTAGVAGVATGHPLLGLAGLGAIEGLASPEPWIATARGLNAIGKGTKALGMNPFFAPAAGATAATAPKRRMSPFEQ